MGRLKTKYGKTSSCIYVLIAVGTNQFNRKEDLLEVLETSIKQLRRYVSEINLTFSEFHIPYEIKFNKGTKKYNLIEK